MEQNLPELDLNDFIRGGAASRQAFSDELMGSLQRYGFFTLRNHLASAALLDQAYIHCAELFALPVARKQEYARGVRGYVPFGTEHAKDGSPADLKEFWQIGPQADPESAAPGQWAHLVPANIWPDAPPGFRPTFT